MNDELIAKVKAWVGDPARAPLLHDLLHAEVGRIIEQMQGEEFAAGAPYSDDELLRRVTAYEMNSADLACAAGIGCYWAHPEMRPLWPGLITRLANGVNRTSGVGVWLNLMLYPAVLVLYSAGIAATAARRYDLLGALLTEATVYDREERHQAVLRLHSQAVIEPEIARRLPGLDRRQTPISDRLTVIIRPWLTDLIPIDADFEHQFDRFECVLGLVHYDIRRATEHAWAPVGRFSWKRMREGVDAEVFAEIESAGERWPLLAAGLFGGSSERLIESASGFKAHVDAVKRQR